MTMAEAMTDEFIDDMVQAADGFASLYAGTSEDEMRAALFDVCVKFELELAEKFGPDVALKIALAFSTAVLRRRRELEAAGDATPRVVN
jgi:hypothetical protein